MSPRAMTLQAATGEPLSLAGDAYARGRAQADVAPETADAVRAAIRLRLDEAAARHARADMRRFLDGQAELLARIDPEGFAETRGVADGFGTALPDLLAYLHLGTTADMAADGCSVVALRCGGGALLAKNRDFRGEHVALQRVFRHVDPARPGEALICVGSLGSPGAYSSGINAHGLALADTHVPTKDHGPGLLRYFLMTRLLWRARSVDEALAEIASVTHAGGGSLMLADRSGAMAFVELGHRRIAIGRGIGGGLAHTNHFTVLDRDGGESRDPDNSRRRLARIENWLAGLRSLEPEADMAALMASRDDSEGPGLFRDGNGGGARTISTSLFVTAEPALYFAPVRQGAGGWERFGAGAGAGEAGSCHTMEG